MGISLGGTEDKNEAGDAGEQADERALLALKAFVHVMNRYNRRQCLHWLSAHHTLCAAYITLIPLLSRTLHRYKARMVTKEVEKVLPLLAHDQDLRHKAVRIF